MTNVAVVTDDLLKSIGEMLVVLAERGDIPSHIALMQISPATQLWEFGLDSLSRINMVIEIEDRFGCQVRDDAITDMTSMAELMSLLASSCSTQRLP